jgi:hypothetical protein
VYLLAMESELVPGPVGPRRIRWRAEGAGVASGVAGTAEGAVEDGPEIVTGGCSPARK